jgi:hypothetical protein
MSNIIIVTCPHCELLVEIESINCAIFRHGIFKKNNKQINPHACKTDCDNYIINNMIIGCGKPFKLEFENNEYRAIICDYI